MSLRLRLSPFAWVCVSVCLSVCLPGAPLLSQEGPLLGGRHGGKGGLGRAKGAAEALRWVWAPGRMGAWGPSWAAPRPAGGSEDCGLWWSAATHLQGHVALSSEGDGEGGRGRQAGEGLERPRVGGRRDLRAPHPTPQPSHACPAGAPVPEALWVPRPGGGLGPGVAVCVRGAASACHRAANSGLPESGRRSCGSSAARAQGRAVARWPDWQVRAKGRRSAGLLGRLAAAASI